VSDDAAAPTSVVRVVATPILVQMVPEGSSDPQGIRIGPLFLSTETAAGIFFYLLRGGMARWGEGEDIPQEVSGALDMLREIPFEEVAKDGRIIILEWTITFAFVPPPPARATDVRIGELRFSLEEALIIAWYFFRGGAAGKWPEDEAPLPVRAALTMLLEVTYKKTETGWAKRHAGASDTPPLMN